MSRRVKKGTRSADPASASPARPGARGFARPAGLASRLARFAGELGRGRRRAEALAALMRATSSTRVPERMAGAILDLACEWFGVEGWAMLSVNEGRGLQWLADRGVPRAHRAAVTSAAERTVHRGRVAWLAGDGPAAGGGHGDPAPLVAIPAKSHGRPVAVLVGLEPDGARPPAEPPDGQALAPVIELVDWMAGALDTAMRLQRASALSTTDDLTGLYNSRFLNLALRREVKRAVRTRRPLSLLFIDLDGFKGINDRYGHLHGSRALVEAAQRIASAARETDVVARFGGDEFAIVLPDTNGGGAAVVARRVRDRVAGEPFLSAAGIDFPLTASVGAATLAAGRGTPEALLAAADQAMYRVKGRGKNGFEAAVVPPPKRDRRVR